MAAKQCPNLRDLDLRVIGQSKAKPSLCCSSIIYEWGLTKWLPMKFYKFPSTASIDTPLIGPRLVIFPSSMAMVLDNFLTFLTGPPQGTLISPWGVVPKHFYFIQTVTHIIPLNTKFHQIPTPKNKSNMLSHTSTCWTSFQTSLTFFNVFIRKLSKWLVFIIFYLKKVTWLLETNFRPSIT